MKTTIIKVQFHNPVDGSCEWHFTSLAAIFDRFSPAQIGCSLRTLWDNGIAVGSPKATRNCIISRHPLFSKPQSNTKNRLSGNYSM